MSPAQDLAVVAAGVFAGIANTVAGGGSLISFPVLIATGLSPFSANVTNAVGLMGGIFAGAGGYRREVAAQRARLVSVLIPVLVGTAIGLVVLLTLPATVFSRIVPALIGVACLALLLQPMLLSWSVKHRLHTGPWPLRTALVPVSAYGAYFGAGLGIINLAVLGMFVEAPMPQLNGIKLVLAVIINSVSAVVFVVAAPIAWWPCLLLIIGSTAGAVGITPVARRIPEKPLRVGIAIVGISVALRLALGH